MKVKALRAAFPYTIPIFAGFWFLALAYGIYMNTAGFSFVYPMFMSMLMNMMIVVGFRHLNGALIACLVLVHIATMAMSTLTELTYVWMTITRAMQRAKHGVRSKAYRHTNDDLYADDPAELRDRSSMCQENRNELVRGRENYRHERACCNEASGIERTCHGGEATLR